LRVLQIHNRYQQAGGEDVVVRAERALLEDHGHEVELFEADNAKIAGFSGHVRTALGTVYSHGAKVCVARRIATFRPDVVHVHNFFPLLSPAIFYACREAGIPVVQTLHNYRLICPNALLLRSGRPCEDCVGKKFAWPGVLHACYRDSRLGTASVATMTSVHRWTGTWRNQVDVFIALTEFSKRKLVQGGLPDEKIVVKPNFVSDPGSAGDGNGGFALFVGRLSEEKGIELLLSAWKRSSPTVGLKVVGDGPLAIEVAETVGDSGVEWLGQLAGEKVRQLMRQASFLAVPSLCYETFSLAIIEAFAARLPVIAAGHGSMASLVEHGRTGLHFRAGDAEDLAAKVEWALNHPKEMARMRREVRAEYLAKYTPERNYEMLMEIYDRVTRKKHEVKTGLSHSEIVG
jgi:glycosyltransferase involved in cell wall biosynthesis